MRGYSGAPQPPNGPLHSSPSAPSTSPRPGLGLGRPLGSTPTPPDLQGRVASSSGPRLSASSSGPRLSGFPQTPQPPHFSQGPSSASYAQAPQPPRNSYGPSSASYPQAPQPPRTSYGPSSASYPQAPQPPRTSYGPSSASYPQASQPPRTSYGPGGEMPTPTAQPSPVQSLPAPAPQSPPSSSPPAFTPPRALPVDDVMPPTGSKGTWGSSLSSVGAGASSWATSKMSKVSNLAATMRAPVPMNRDDDEKDVEMHTRRGSSSGTPASSADHGDPVDYDLPATANPLLVLVANREVRELKAKIYESADPLVKVVDLDLSLAAREGEKIRGVIVRDWKAKLIEQRKAQAPKEQPGDAAASIGNLVEQCVNCAVRCCRCCCCCCRCLCAEPSSSSSSSSSGEGQHAHGVGYLRGYRRNGEGKLLEEWFDPRGHTLLGIAVRMHSYSVVHVLLEWAANGKLPHDDKHPEQTFFKKQKAEQAFLDLLDVERNSAAYYASKLYDWDNEKDPSNGILKLLVKDCGASFIVPELAHFYLSNDLLFFFASIFVIVGYVVCINWTRIMAATVGQFTAVNTVCDTLYGISLKPIFLTFLDAATMRILQYFSSNPRYTWLLAPLQQALDFVSGGGKIPENADQFVVGKLADAQGQIADKLQAVQNPTFALSQGQGQGQGMGQPRLSSLRNQASGAFSEQLSRDGSEVFDQAKEQYDDLQEKREQAEHMAAKAKRLMHKHSSHGGGGEDEEDQGRGSIADDYPERSEFRESAYHKLPNPLVDDPQSSIPLLKSKSAKKKRKEREETLKQYITDASAFDDVSGRMGSAIRSNSKMIFIFVQCAKFVFTTIFAMAKAQRGTSTFQSYVNWYGLIMNGDLPTVIFSLMAPVHMDLSVLHELDDSNGAMGLLITLWHVFLYFWHRFCDIFSFKKFGYWSFLMMFPFVIIIPPVFSHFMVACTLYFWIGFICLVGALIGWRFKGIFFCILRCFERCFDVWFILYVVIEIVARFGFVVYLQILYNVMSVIYLQDSITDPKNYFYGLTWTWHLTMNPQCFAQNKDVSMLLVYLSSF